MRIKYELIKNDKEARLGKLITNHGTFDTPMFMPVGTLANVIVVVPVRGCHGRCPVIHRIRMPEGI